MAKKKAVKRKTVKKKVERKSKFPIVVPMKRDDDGNWRGHPLFLCEVKLKDYYNIPTQVESIRVRILAKPSRHSYPFKIIREVDMFGDRVDFALRYKRTEITMHYTFKALALSFGFNAGSIIHVEVEYDI